MSDGPIICADCKRDLKGRAPVLFASSARHFACLCPTCANAYSTPEEAFGRLRSVVLASERPGRTGPVPVAA